MRRRLGLMRLFLQGDPSDASGRAIVLAVTSLGAVASTVANVAGAAVVFLLLAFVLPTPDDVPRTEVVIRNLVVGSGYLFVSLVTGASLGLRRTVRTLTWLRDEREPLDEEREAVLGLAFHVTMRQARYWLVAVVAFTALNVPVSVVLGVEVGLTVLMGGTVTAASTYLLYQRIARPAVARALEEEPPGKFRVPGVTLRIFLIWSLGTAVPVAGVALVAGGALVVGDVGTRELAVAALVLSVAALAAGFFTMMVFARSLADPLATMRNAVRRIEGGDLDVAVPVYDASEVGFLQSGLNRMTAGLREREHLRDLFGRHVGAEVARRALADGGVTLGGEERDVGVLFVDVVGSTTYTSRHDPAEVVAALNDFFAIVVEVVQAHGGLVNKFEGDAALCVWGAPLSHPDPAGAALAAARDLVARLDASDALPAGVGVSAGTVVAGNIGAEDRLEYTVIGDPVNEASRLTELAKQSPGRIIASSAAVGAAASEDEAGHWQQDGHQVLRGRDEPTGLSIPSA